MAAVSVLEGFMNEESQETKELLDRIEKGEQDAVDLLIEGHIDRLRDCVGLRAGGRLGARVGVSDILQETCIEAARRLPGYVRERKMPFFLWLRWIAREKLQAACRHHLGAEKRAAHREELHLPVDRSAAIARSLIGNDGTPSRAARRDELALAFGRALDRLGNEEREIILWRHFEHLSNGEVALLLKISHAAATKRYVRALDRLRAALRDSGISASSGTIGPDAAHRVAEEVDRQDEEAPDKEKDR